MNLTLARTVAITLITLGLSGCSGSEDAGTVSAAPATTTAEQSEFVRCVDVITTAVMTDLTDDSGVLVGSGQVIRVYGRSGPEHAAYTDVVSFALTTMMRDGMQAAEAGVDQQAAAACAQIHPDGAIALESATTLALSVEQQIDECVGAVSQALTDTFLAATDGDPATQGPVGDLARVYGANSAIWSAFSDLSGPFMLAATDQGLDAGLASTDVTGTCTTYVDANSASGASTDPAGGESGSTDADMRAVVESFVAAWIDGDYDTAASYANDSAVDAARALPLPDPAVGVKCFTDEGGFPLCGTQLVDASVVVFEVDSGIISAVRPWDPDLG
jgi:hypothetical protein